MGGLTGGLTGPDDQRVLSLLRMLCDALVVGAGTLRREGYGAMTLAPEQQHWRRAHGMPPNPTLVAVSSLLDLDPRHALFVAAPVRPIVVTHEGAPAPRRAALARVADVMALGDTAIDLPAVVRVLADRGLPRLLSEGGPTLFGALHAARLVDEVCLTLAPLLAGPGASRITAGPPGSEPTGLELVHVLTNGAELFTRYRRATSLR